MQQHPAREALLETMMSRLSLPYLWSPRDTQDCRLQCHLLPVLDSLWHRQSVLETEAPRGLAFIAWLNTDSMMCGGTRLRFPWLSAPPGQELPRIQTQPRVQVRAGLRHVIRSHGTRRACMLRDHSKIASRKLEVPALLSQNMASLPLLQRACSCDSNSFVLFACCLHSSSACGLKVTTAGIAIC